jgi:Mrp family chromosome partitioning ATPase
MSCGGECESCPLRETCASGGVPAEMQEAVENVREALSEVAHKILVLSGKGGVGKSTFAYLLSRTLAVTEAVTVLDLDLCGPSMPFLFNTPNEKLLETSFGYEPCYCCRNVGLVSSQFFLPNEDDPLVARGPRKNRFVLELLKDVDWGETATLLVDTPPGTSDEHLSIVSFMSRAGIDGAVIVTTPEEVALADVRREVRFCRRAGVRILGVVENMAVFVCPDCGRESSMYPATTGGAAALCDAEGLFLLGRLPVEPSLVAGIVGAKYPIPPAVEQVMSSIVERLRAQLQTG